MTIHTRPDGELRELVLSHIKKELEAASNAIEVAMEGGVVTLIGSVKSLADKIAAENAAKEVGEAMIVADELTVTPPHQHTDTQIAREVLLCLRTHPGLPQNVIRATITDGEVTLEGIVHWQVQKLTAESIISNLKGVKRIRNLIEVRPPEAAARAVPARESTLSSFS
jgi:osmotically-inducible protein OsmY